MRNNVRSFSFDTSSNRSKNSRKTLVLVEQGFILQLAQGYEDLKQDLTNVLNYFDTNNKNYSKFLPEYGDVLTVDEVKEVLKTGYNTVYGLLQSGELESKIIGGKYRIPKLSVWNYLYPKIRCEEVPFSIDDPENDEKEEVYSVSEE